MLQILLLTLLPLALAQYGGYGDDKHEPHYPPQPYKFGYDVKDHYGATLQQKEEGDSHGNKKGSYGYTDGHGIYRQVDYVADKNGFRASIKTNEPGTSDEDPADVHLDSSAKQVEYHSEPSRSHSYSRPSYSQSVPSYKSYSAPSYSAPSYSASSYSAPSYQVLSHSAPSYKSYESNNYGGQGGYARSHSIPAVYYAKGY